MAQVKSTSVRNKKRKKHAPISRNLDAYERIAKTRRVIAHLRDSYTTKELAERYRVSPSTIRRWQHGQSVPKLKNYNKLARSYQQLKKKLPVVEKKVPPRIHEHYWLEFKSGPPYLVLRALGIPINELSGSVKNLRNRFTIVIMRVLYIVPGTKDYPRTIKSSNWFDISQDSVSEINNKLMLGFNRDSAIVGIYEIYLSRLN